MHEWYESDLEKWAPFTKRSGKIRGISGKVGASNALFLFKMRIPLGTANFSPHCRAMPVQGSRKTFLDVMIA